MASPCASSRFGTGLKKRHRGHHCVVDRQIVFRRASLVRDVRAIRFGAGGVVKLVQAPKPERGPEDVVVQVLAAGVCRTDLHLLDEVKAGTHPPLIPGHEIAGRVATIGADVYTAKVGDLVGVHFEQPCGHCRQCRRQRTNLCEDGTTLGFDAPGGYAEFVVAKQTTILPLPPNFDVASAARWDAAAPPRTGRSWPSARPRKGTWSSSSGRAASAFPPSRSQRRTTPASSRSNRGRRQVRPLSTPAQTARAARARRVPRFAPSQPMRAPMWPSFSSGRRRRSTLGGLSLVLEGGSSRSPREGRPLTSPQAIW